jgi:hypothetical protein
MIFKAGIKIEQGVQARVRILCGYAQLGTAPLREGKTVGFSSS